MVPLRPWHTHSPASVGMSRPEASSRGGGELTGRRSLRCRSGWSKQRRSCGSKLEHRLPDTTGRGRSMGSVVIAERTIHYHTVASRPAAPGQKVLYVHGTGCNGQVWLPHMTAIANAHTPVAVDLPGHGGSPGFGFRGVGDYTYFVVELSKALGWNRFVLVGHSL